MPINDVTWYRSSHINKNHDEAFEMWLYRRILRMSYIDHVINKEVLRQLSKTKKLHPDVKLHNIKLHCLPSNVTSVIQFMDQGAPGV